MARYGRRWPDGSVKVDGARWLPSVFFFCRKLHSSFSATEGFDRGLSRPWLEGGFWAFTWRSWHRLGGPWVAEISPECWPSEPSKQKINEVFSSSPVPAIDLAAGDDSGQVVAVLRRGFSSSVTVPQTRIENTLKWSYTGLRWQLRLFPGCPRLLSGLSLPSASLRP